MHSKFLYNDEGYANIAGIIDRGNVYNAVFGGRGTGKTFNAIKTADERNWVCLWLRRGAAEAQVCACEASSPWKAYMYKQGRRFRVYGAKGLSEVWEVEEDEKGDVVQRIKLLGYVGSLTNFSSIRGFDMSDVKIIFFDEFVPETASHVKIKDEYGTFLNLYESVNRNRELEGNPPCICVLMANQNTQSSAIVAGLGLDTVVEQMEDTHADHIEYNRASLGVYRLDDSPISQKKRETALYRLAEFTGAHNFTTMALDNRFTVRDDLARRVKLSACELECVIGDIWVYKPNNSRDGIQLHVVRGTEPAKPLDVVVFPPTKKGYANASAMYGKPLQDAYKQGRMTYDCLQTVSALFDSMGVNVF